PLPRGRVALLERESLRVRTVAQQDRMSALVNWAIDVGSQHDSVIHLDGHVPIDPHAVADLGGAVARHPVVSGCARMYSTSRAFGRQSACPRHATVRGLRSGP